MLERQGVMLTEHSPGVSSGGGLGGPKEPKGAHEQQEGHIERAQDPPQQCLLPRAGGQQRGGRCRAGHGRGAGGLASPSAAGCSHASAQACSLHPPNISMNWCQDKRVRHVQAPYSQRDS